MKFYHRYDENGTCEVICTSCFLTLGFAERLADVKEMESRHVCRRRAIHERLAARLPNDHSSGTESRSALNRIPGSLLRPANTSILLLSVIFLFYALPTILEFLAARHLSPWLAIILPGDLIGCACLIAIFKAYRTGTILYLLLTAGESYLYASHTVAANALLWVVDLVPALCVAAMILRVRPANTTQHTVLS